MLRVGWLSTGRDKAARDLLTTVYQAIQDGEVKARIDFVFSNREPGEQKESDRFFQLAHQYELDIFSYCSKHFKEYFRKGRDFEEVWRTQLSFFPSPTRKPYWADLDKECPAPCRVPFLPLFDIEAVSAKRKSLFGTMKFPDRRHQRRKLKRLAHDYQLALLPTEKQTPLLPLLEQETVGRESWRKSYEKRVKDLFELHSPDIFVLAGCMLVVGEEMCRRYPMINLHPAGPGGPKGTWQEVIWQLIRARARASGVMMHLVTPELDQGPPVTFCTYPLRGGRLDPLWSDVESLPWEKVQALGERLPLFRAVREEGLKREFPLIVATLRAFGEGEVKIGGGRVLDRQDRAIPGHNLTAEIEKALAGKPG